MSPRLFLVNVEAPETRVAETRDGRLFDLDIERDARLLGNIYKARVENIVPGMDAAFVNIGEKRNALLYVGDIIGGERGSAIGSLLKTRDEILVQVARPPVGTKGARVTMRLSLPGRFGILVYGSETVGVSKRVEESDERSRLRRIGERLRPLDRGIILRTEAHGATEHQISADLSSLESRLQAIITRGKNVETPALLHEDLGLLGRIARDRVGDDVSAIWIDSPRVFESFVAQLQLYAPHLAPRARLYSEAAPIFARFGVEKDIAVAAKRSVELPGGGSLVWDEAEALTAVDVNSGSNVGRRNLEETVVATNLTAVNEIARQLRLRDVGGIVVVDFIDMKRTRDRARVLDALEKALSDDRGRSRIVQISPTGLVEMTRRREGDSLGTILNEPCPACEGLGFVPRAQTIALEARRHLRALALKSQGGNFSVTLHPEVALALLGEEAEWLQSLEAETNAQIRVRVDPLRARDDWDARHTSPETDTSPFQVGTLLPFSSDAPLYGSEEKFVVARNTLVRLNAAPDGASDEPRLLEISSVGRHFACARWSGSKTPQNANNE